MAPAKTADTDSKSSARGRRKEITTDQLVQLLRFDQEVLIRPRKAPIEIIIGTDEVGRGCLAGPVVAAAVVLPEIDPLSELAWQLARLNDSKQIKPDVRAELCSILKQHCQYAVGEASVYEIDQINILQASLLAMRRAIRKLKVTAPAVVLVDGNQRIKSMRTEQVTVINGDNKSASIAAASIIAKVHRDSFMTQLANQFPEYRWDSNKGYRSRDHWHALNELGMTKWHRRTFVEHWLSNPDEPFANE